MFVNTFMQNFTKVFGGNYLAGIYFDKIAEMLNVQGFGNVVICDFLSKTQYLKANFYEKIMFFVSKHLKFCETSDRIEKTG